MSSLEQNLDRQIDQLRAAGVSQIYKEKISGSTRHRPQLEEVLRYLRKGDQLIVTSMDRLARSLVDLHAIVEDLVGRGVSVRFLREGQTYSAKADPIAKLMLGLMGSVAESRMPGAGWTTRLPCLETYESRHMSTGVLGRVTQCDAEPIRRTAPPRPTVDRDSQRRHR
nr:recombinase family protein [Corynebacterium mycetoides]